MSIPIRLSSSRITRWLLLNAFLIVVIHLVSWVLFDRGHEQVRVVRMLFDLREEGNIPQFFSALLFVFIAALLAIGQARSNAGGTKDRAWGILALLALFLGFDEAGQIHEKLNKSTHAMLGGGDLGVLNYSWVVPYTVLVIVVGLASIRFLKVLDAPTRIRLVVSAAVFISGSLGMELLEGYLASLPNDSAPVMMSYTVEESLEMVGAILAIRTFLLHFAERGASAALEFRR